jgi:hypothetical protein
MAAHLFRVGTVAPASVPLARLGRAFPHPALPGFAERVAQSASAAVIRQQGDPMHRSKRSEVVRPRLIIAVVAVALLSAACGSQDDDVALSDGASPTPATVATAPSPTSSPTSSPTPSDDEPQATSDGGPQATPVFNGGTEDVVLEGAQGDVAVLQQVRVARQAEFDRVTWEFSGDVPTVRAGYDDEPLEPGRGEPVDVAGTTAVVMAAEPAVDLATELHAPAQEAYDGPERITGSDTEVVSEAVRMGDFEANLQWAVGVNSRQPFRVDTLENPLRVVLDIAH